MIKLRVVGTTDDYDQLVLSNKARGAKGSHVVMIDKKLLDVLQEAVYGKREARLREKVAPYAMPERVEPKVPPKEIQRQLRAGKSAKDVAAALEVPQSLVERFLQPVVYERIEVVNDVQDAIIEKPRLGRSALSVGDAIVANLTARRVSMDPDRLASAWTATRKNGDPWAVSFTFPYRGRSRVARWKFDPRSRSVEPANALARDIGWAAKGTKKVGRVQDRAASDGRSASTGPAKGRARAKPKAKATSSRAGAKRKAPKRAAKKTTARKTSARKKPVAKKPAKRKTAKPKTAKRKTAKPKTAKRKTAKRKTAKPKTAKRKTAKRAAPRRGRTAPRSRGRTTSARSPRSTRRGSARRR